MREILFRGKRIENGEWVYGDLFSLFERHCIKFGKTDKELVGVRSETVGQYTGLLDRNGNKIFEGDILKADVLCNTCGASPKPIYIHFADGAFCWAENKNDEKNTLALCDSEHFRDLKLYEVIGNIYDNTELIEDKL